VSLGTRQTSKKGCRVRTVKKGKLLGGTQQFQGKRNRINLVELEKGELVRGGKRTAMKSNGRVAGKRGGGKCILTRRKNSRVERTA